MSTEQRLYKVRDSQSIGFRPARKNKLLEMAVHKMFALLLVVTVTALLTDCRGNEIYVSLAGYDTPGCGTSDLPCKSIRFGIGRSVPYTQLMIDGTGGPYTNETGKGYIRIEHSLSLTAWKSRRFTIQCTKKNATLFRVVGATSASNDDSEMMYFYISNVVIQNCQDHDDFGVNAGVIYVENARLSLNNSAFFQNDVLVHHPQTGTNGTCDAISVFVKNCSFGFNFRPRPLVYGLALFGCADVSLRVEDSSFVASPVDVKSDNATFVSFTRVAFDGNGLRGSSVRITTSPGANAVSFSNCSVINHEASKTSPVSISVDAVPTGVSTVTFTETRFRRNRRLATAGAALSINSVFEKMATLNIQIKRCTFEDNSGSDSGGAVHVAYVNQVHMSWCRFFNNTGLNGGAIHVYRASNVTIASCSFENNTARPATGNQYMAKGGAIYADRSDVELTFCNLTGNTASYTGSAIFASECDGVSLTSTRIENTETGNETSSHDTAVLISTTSNIDSNLPTVRLNKNVFIVGGFRDCNVIFSKGQIYTKNNSIKCSQGKNFDFSSRPVDYDSRYYDYTEVGLWCESCPPGTYTISEQQVAYDDRRTETKKEDCKPCPENAVCEYGAVKSRPNYWGYSVNNTVSMSLCPMGYCCDRQSTCSGYQTCAVNRAGTLCGRCIEEHTHSIRFGYVTCVGTQRCWGLGATLAFTICFSAAFLLVLLWFYSIFGVREPGLIDKTREARNGEEDLANDDRPTAEENEDELRPIHDESERDGAQKKRDIPVSASSSLVVYLISFVSFYQLAPSVYPRLTSSTATVDVIVNALIELFSFLSPLSAATICFPALPVAAAQFLLQSAVYWSILVALAFLFIVFAATFGSEKMTNRFSTAFVLFFIVSYVPLIRICLQATACVTVADGLRITFTDAATSCYEIWQVFVVVYLIVFVAPLCLVIEGSSKLLSRGDLSYRAYVLLHLFPLFGAVWLIYRLLTSGRPFEVKPQDDDRDDLTSLTSENPQINPAALSVPSTLTKPFKNRIRFFGVEVVSSLTLILFRNLLLALFAGLLAPHPAIHAIATTVTCVAFMVSHFRLNWFHDIHANLLESSLLLLLSVFSAMNIFSSLSYVFGQGVDESGLFEAAFDWIYRVSLLLVFAVFIVCVWHRLHVCFRKRHG